jgi:CRP-like cAMP-binding protein
MSSSVKQALPGLGERWEEFAHLFRRRTVKAGTVLLKEGQVARSTFMIEEGCLRAAYDHKGRDITCQFFFEGEGVSSFESFQFGTPSLVRIEAVERSVLWTISRPDLDRLLREVPELRETANDHVLRRMAYYMRQMLSFLRDTPAERYALLLKERPQVVQRVPQYLIASYLGITPVSLSRIRGRLKSGRAS